MIVTENAVYLHLPKTAGTWMREVLKPIILEWHDHRVLTESIDKPVFVFTRNPWAWHVSMYHFLQKGSEYYQPNNHAIAPPVIQALPVGHSFDTFIRAITSPTDKFKKMVYSIYQMRTRLYDDRADTAIVEKQILDTWLPSNVGYCQHIYNTYTQYATRIGKNETIRDDLLSMAESVGDLTVEVRDRILNTHPINVTGLTKETRDYYTPDLTDMVTQSCPYINEQGYTFQ
jgi:hypothetical protein